MLPNYNPFETAYQEFIYKSRYSRWLDGEQRRENWEETVKRYTDFLFKDRAQLPQDWYQKIYDSIYTLQVMPSMRALMTAGPALERDNTCGYNCAYLTVDDPKAFDEAMFILLCGTGVGFSVERQYVQKLPEVPDKLYDSETTVVVKDSKEGWAKSFRQVLSLLWSGEIPKWDTTQVRPAGAKLKTFGGRASGPGPLEDLFRFSRDTFKNAAGRKLSSIECHDLLCKVGEVVVVGGVRRSAMISLSNLTDERMRNAKNGQWWEANSHRALANNSVCYTEKPDVGIFMKEWLSLYDSKSGERGIFNREASRRQVESLGRRDPNYDFGTNPCSEIILRPNQFCNLTEVVLRSDDDYSSIASKLSTATLMGTLQSSLVYFPYLRKIWTKNTEEERLLGVSLTGIMDLKTPLSADELRGLRDLCVAYNKEFSGVLGIPQSTAVTCVKPSGTVSQLVDSSSGIHARHSLYYHRTVRADNKDPLTLFMKDAGVYSEPDVTKPDTTTVFSFPVKSPEGTLTRNDLSAIDQLNIWQLYQDNWCEHKPSVTVTVKEREWPTVGAWVYENFNKISGISFLPHSDHTYRQAPYQECSEEDYLKLLKVTPKSFDWNKLSDYEREDSTASSSTFACSGGSCEIVDLTK